MTFSTSILSPSISPISLCSKLWFRLSAENLLHFTSMCSIVSNTLQLAQIKGLYDVVNELRPQPVQESSDKPQEPSDNK